MKREQPIPEAKFIEIKKNLINYDIKKILEVPEIEVNNKHRDEIHNLGGENLLIPDTKTLDNLIPTHNKNDNSKKFSVLGNLGVVQSILSMKQHNFDQGNHMNISKISKLDINEIWDNSILENNNYDLFNNSKEFK